MEQTIDYEKIVRNAFVRPKNGYLGVIDVGILAAKECVSQAIEQERQLLRERLYDFARYVNKTELSGANDYITDKSVKEFIKLLESEDSPLKTS